MGMKKLPRSVVEVINAQHPPPTPTTNPFAGMKELGKGQFTDSVIEYAQARLWKVAHFRPARVMRGGKEIYETPVVADGKGFLDLECVRRDRLVKIELKVHPNVPTPEQLNWITAYELAGVEVYLFYPEDWELLVEVLE